MVLKCAATVSRINIAVAHHVTYIKWLHSVFILPCKGFIIFEILAEGLQKQAEFTKFQIVISMLTVSLRLGLGIMEGSIYSLKNRLFFLGIIRKNQD